MCSHRLEKIVDSRILHGIELCKFLALSALFEFSYTFFIDNPLFEKHMVFLVDDIHAGRNGN